MYRLWHKDDEGEEERYKDPCSDKKELTVADKQRIQHGEEFMWSMPYAKTKSWRQSYVVNVPRHTSRQAKNSTCRRDYVVHNIFKNTNMETMVCGKWCAT
jgi:hypothetical protein